MFRALSALFSLILGLINVTSEEGLGIYSDVLKTSRVWTNSAHDISKAEAADMLAEYSKDKTNKQLTIAAPTA